MPENESIVAFGTQMAQYNDYAEGTCLLFRLKLAGDVTVGFGYSRDAKDPVLSKSPPQTLIYDTSELEPALVIGAYAEEAVPGQRLSPFCYSLVDDPPFENACFSIAPLDGVSHVRVFIDTQSGLYGYLVGLRERHAAILRAVESRRRRRTLPGTGAHVLLTQDFFSARNGSATAGHESSEFEWRRTVMLKRVGSGSQCEATWSSGSRKKNPS